MKSQCTRYVLSLAALIGLGVHAGCEGNFVMTAPDQIAPAGGQAMAVLRLQRNEFAGFLVPVEKAAIRLQVENGPVRGTFTDKQGYAAAAVPVGNELGKYHLGIAHLDRNGDEAQGFFPVFVWNPEEFLLAVELDGLLKSTDPAAREAMKELANCYHIVYFTDRPPSEHARMHAQLQAAALPDGPILAWQQESWRLEQDGKMWRLVVEDRTISALARLRTQFPELKQGIAFSGKSARAFHEAGLKVNLVGKVKTNVPAKHSAWPDLARNGL